MVVGQILARVKTGSGQQRGRFVLGVDGDFCTFIWGNRGGLWGGFLLRGQNR